MKSILKLSFLLLFAVSFTACDSNKSDDNNNNNNGGSGTMTANIDGAAWSAANATATKITFAGITTITVAGADAGAKAMTISLIGVTGTGTFTIGSNNLGSMSWIDDASGSAYIATSGSVTLTTINDSKVKGTFSFDGTRFSDNAMVSVTNGTFDVGYGPSIF